MVLIRHAMPGELEEPVGFIVNDPVGFVDADWLREEMAAGPCRPEWTWFAVDGSRIVARAVWWGPVDSERPLALDCLHVPADVPDRAALATELLVRGHAERVLQSSFEKSPLEAAFEQFPDVWRHPTGTWFVLNSRRFGAPCDCSQAKSLGAYSSAI